MRLLRRGVEWITANDVVLAGIVLGALIVVFFFDIVFLGRTLISSLTQPGVLGFEPPFGYPWDKPDSNPYLVDPLASAAGAEPLVERMGRLIRDFQVSLWNPNITLGRPFLGEASNANFSVIRLPLMIWSSPEMWDAFLLTRFLVAGLFTYLLAKRLGLAKPASFGAAVAFSFSGFFMIKVNMEHVDYAMMIPVLLYAFELLLERPGPARMTFAVAAVAAGVLAVNVQPALLLLLYGSAYYLARMIALPSRERGFRLLRRTLPLGMALGLGVGLTAFMLLPFLQLAGTIGFGKVGVHVHEGRGVLYDRLPALITLFVPYFNGPPVGAIQGPGWTGIRNYVGVVTPVLAFIGLWNRPAMGKAGIFFLGAAVLLLAKTYGVPVVNDVGRFPLFDALDFPQYLPPAIAFSLAMLAGLGLDQLARTGWRWWHPLLGMAVLALVLGWLVWLNRDILGGIPDTHLAVQLGFAIGLIVATAAIALAARWRRVPAHTAMVVLAGLIALELFAFTTPTKGEFASLVRTVYAGDDVRVIERPKRYDPFTEPPYIAFLKEDPSTYRVVGLRSILFPNSSEAYDIDDIRGIVGIGIDRYMRYIRGFIDPEVKGHRFKGTGWPRFTTKDDYLLLADNPMFDLLNVKYVITPKDSLLGRDPGLAPQFLPIEPEENARIRLDLFSINGEDEAVLFQHPTNSLSYTFTPDKESRFLLFRLALDPSIWQPDKGDGVLFQVSVREDGDEETLFSQWVDPKNNPEDRRWIDGEVDLSPYLDRPVELVLSTFPGEAAAWDWAGWGALRLAPSPESPAGQPSDKFELVYDGEVNVYENRGAFDRAFIVHRAVVTTTPDSAAALLKRPGFDPSTEAVVEGGPSDGELAALAASPIADGSSVEITDYGDSRVKLRARMENPGLLVLSDSYYPGWKAYVDGKQVPIYPTDLALRSIYLTPGEHDVEFVFSPGSFKLGLAITIASLAVLGSYLAWGPTTRRINRWTRRRSG